MFPITKVLLINPVAPVPPLTIGIVPDPKNLLASTTPSPLGI